MALGDTAAPQPDKGPMAGKIPMDSGNDQISCPCCGQMTTKTQAKSYIDSLPSAGGSPMSSGGMPATDGNGMESPMPEMSMAGKYA